MDKCIHHFIVPLEGIAAVGRCKICGEEKVFLNAPDEAIGFNNQPKRNIVLTNKDHVSVFAKRGRMR